MGLKMNIKLPTQGNNETSPHGSRYESKASYPRENNETGPHGSKDEYKASYPREQLDRPSWV